MRKPISKKYIIITAIGLLFMLLLFMFTSPTEMPLVILVVPFLVMFITIYAGAKVVLGQTTLSGNKKRQTMIASASGALPVLLLIFQSIHQLTLRDVLVSISLVAAVVFYISRADFIA